MRVFAAAFALAALAPAPAAAACKLALALGLDISSSVNSDEYRIQLDGLARAFRTPEVVEAMLSPPGASVAVITYEWSGYAQQDLITGWEVIYSPGAAAAYAARLEAHRRTYSDFPTALGKAVEYGAGLLRRAPPCARRVLDLSGDGENNDGLGPDEIRAKGLLDGITINGLVIQGAMPDPGIYYRTHVMQGPGAFVALARDFDDYPAVIIGKLLREVGTEAVVGDAR